MHVSSHLTICLGQFKQDNSYSGSKFQSRNELVLTPQYVCMCVYIYQHNSARQCYKAYPHLLVLCSLFHPFNASLPNVLWEEASLGQFITRMVTYSRKEGWVIIPLAHWGGYGTLWRQRVLCRIPTVLQSSEEGLLASHLLWLMGISIKESKFSLPSNLLWTALLHSDAQSLCNAADKDQNLKERKSVVHISNDAKMLYSLSVLRMTSLLKRSDTSTELYAYKDLHKHSCLFAVSKKNPPLCFCCQLGVGGGKCPGAKALLIYSGWLCLFGEGGSPAKMIQK